MYLSQCYIALIGGILFSNNTADNGAALYLDYESSTVIINGQLQFVNNSAAYYGGAVFVKLGVACNQNDGLFHLVNVESQSLMSFINNVAGYGGDSIYFSISKHCNIIANSSDRYSIMNVPYQFNYSQIINGVLTHISTDYNYTWLNVSQFPVITSPHRLILYGNSLVCCQTYANSLCESNTYYVGHKILGKSINFKGTVINFFNKPAENVKYHTQCRDCPSMWRLMSTEMEIDNVSPSMVTLVGETVANETTNVTIDFISYLNYFYDPIEVVLVVEIVPCPEHPGYYYSHTVKGCICYHHDIVECHEGYNEIKRGYWFGSVNGQATTSLCPYQYCEFDHSRKETRDGYYMLPKMVDDQCKHHRLGRACGKCSPKYTLAYDSTVCISVDNCSAGITVLVVVLTCFYWIAILAVSFVCVACLKIRVSSGYVCGIIYYYSMVGFLLSNNPFISSEALIFIDIISGFAQLTPRFLGQLCLAQHVHLSGIDQLFIHYFHSFAISLLLSIFVLVARYCKKLHSIPRYYVPVFSLLYLLSYTSITSTSLQLLRPLTFTGVSGVYTYSSPDIKYFHGRHALYGIVALICELVIGIGLPVLLLMKPILKKNNVGLKKFLDEFGDCFKKGYRRFAAYYLLFRQVILFIVLIAAGNYYVMMFCLKISCLVVATIHMWARPYKNKLINIFDGFMLQLMVVVATIGGFEFLHSVMTEICVFLVILPLLIVFIAVVIKKAVDCRKVKRRSGYAPIGEANDSIG